MSPPARIAVPNLARWRLAAFLAVISLPIALGAAQLFLAPVLSRRLCPTTALACWSTSQLSYVFGIIASLTFAAISGVWAVASRFATAPFVAMAAVGSLLIVATGTLSYADGQHYVAILPDGFLVKSGRAAPATLHKWRDLTDVLAFCESGGRAGPRVNLYFRSTTGKVIAVRYNTWRSVTAQVPTIAAETNELPFRTKNMDWCVQRSSYDRLPLQRLN